MKLKAGPPYIANLEKMLHVGRTDTNSLELDADGALVVKRHCFNSLKGLFEEDVNFREGPTVCRYSSYQSFSGPH